ncbi:MAG: IucA/IucC family protein, partial [Solirubrobacteraceae bacterium]
MDSPDDTSAPLPATGREQPQTPGHEAAVSAAIETLLNCYLREGGAWRPVPAGDVPELAQEGDEFVAVLPFPDERAAIIAGVRHLSATHRHRFRTPATIAMAGGNPWVVSVDTLMGMLADELGASESVYDDDLSAPGTRGPDPTFLLSRIRQSITTVGAFLDARAGDVEQLWSGAPLRFIDSEQAGLLGHMAHPTAKSRWELDAEQTAAYAPEAQARFALRWLAVDPALVEHDSATGTPAPELTERLLRDDPAVDGAALDEALAGLGERVLLPVHPWELEHLREREPVAALLADGRIADLGALGGDVAPTT